ncbi:MAG: SURF1 family protein [Xanthomonadales bacterium]|jgi:surfeit locus 1 family protein|nr:SURF1 family protein [Xanthomonadales bacterium]MBN8795883.1 SURF1 family protein [Stenotrophomonas nitritireducens]
MQASRRGRLALLVLLACCCAGFIALGIWQVQRLHWKRALIARVEARVHAAPVPPPARSDWPRIGVERDEYRRLELRGTYLRGRETQTQALTELGAGHWVLSPLQLTDGSIVLVNRGFVLDGARPALPPPGEVRVRGLLRMSEPGGGFLRDNRPAQDRWYSRDVAAIAQARGLGDVAPYFVDAEADAGAGSGWPRAGMTVIHFRNQHLQYALTWFVLAAMALWGVLRLLSEQRRMRHHGIHANGDAHR